MFPFGIGFKRVSNAWLVSRTALILFAVASVLVVAIAPVLWGYVNFLETPGFGKPLLGGGGSRRRVEHVFHLGGMWAYWTRCDSSRRAVKRIWFVILLVGFWYGSVLYYLFKYLPAEGPNTKRGMRRKIGEDFQKRPGGGMGGILWNLGALIASPKTVGGIVAPVTGFIALPPALLLVASLIYGRMCVYKAGMQTAGDMGGMKQENEENDSRPK